MNLYLGGQVQHITTTHSSDPESFLSHPANSVDHAGAKHWISTRDGQRFRVNSYHNWGVSGEHLSHDFVAIAQSEDGWIEAATHVSKPWWGIQWHPERPGGKSEISDALLHEWLNS